MDSSPKNSGMLPTNFQVKASVFKVIEVTYSIDNGISLKAALKKGPVKVTIDDKKKVTFSGNIKSLILSGDPTFEALGARFKALSVLLSLADNGDIKYKATVSCWGIGSFSLIGQFDLEKLVVDRGLLRRAYRPLKNRAQQVEDAVNGN